MKVMKRVWAGVMVSALLFQTSVTTVLADAETQFTPYVSLGADLDATERATVLSLLGVTEEELSTTYTVGTVTNDDEYAYLSSYMDSSVIGTRALSSVKVTKTEEGTGINVSTHNIGYCSADMYRNALATAGVADADVVVAGPFDISGTSALVGTMRAYESMTGYTITEETKDAAVHELVVTGQVSESIGSDQAATDLIAALKDEVLSAGLDTDEEILGAIDTVAAEFDLVLTEQDRQNLLDLLKKLSTVDIDLDAIKQEAGRVLGELESIGVDVDSLQTTITNILQGLLDWLMGLFEENLNEAVANQ